MMANGEIRRRNNPDPPSPLLRLNAEFENSGNFNNPNLTGLHTPTLYYIFIRYIDS
jgi:hypothetical protein